MGSIIGHRIDYNGLGALRGQQHIPSKNLPKYPPSPTGMLVACEYNYCQFVLNVCPIVVVLFLTTIGINIMEYSVRLTLVFYFSTQVVMSI